jgi:iron complex transport system ATP-binding protein
MEFETMRMEIRDLVQGYGEKTVLNGLDLSVESGEVVTILGPNGSGKSTMIKTICGIMDRISGSITIDGTDISEMDKKEVAKVIAYVPQKNDFFGFSTVYDTVLIGRKPYVTWSYSREDIRIAAESMKAMKVDEFYDRPVQNLSGGQLQRVTLARALTQQPEIYIFDEPTSALDLRNQLDTLKLMRTVIQRDNSCMLIALHDLNLALRYSDKVLAIKDGRTYSFGTTEEVITEKMIRDIYGVEAEIVDSPNGKYVHAFDTELDGAMDTAESNR